MVKKKDLLIDSEGNFKCNIFIGKKVIKNVSGKIDIKNIQIISNPPFSPHIEPLTAEIQNFKVIDLIKQYRKISRPFWFESVPGMFYEYNVDRYISFKLFCDGIDWCQRLDKNFYRLLWSKKNIR
jgi:hypothetical protein